jgi:hypothetical protein
MPTPKIITNAKVTIAAFDLTDSATSAVIDADAQMVEITGFGDGSRKFLKSLLNWTATINYTDDFADNGLNELLFTWWQSPSSVAVTVKVDRAAATSPTNPEFQGNCWVSTATLLNANFGQAAGGTLRMQGDGALTRAVA